MDYEMMLMLAVAAVPLAVAIWALFVRRPAAAAAATSQKPNQPPLPVGQKAQHKQKQRNAMQSNSGRSFQPPQIAPQSYNFVKLKGHAAQVCDAVISPNGQYIASSAEADATVSTYAMSQRAAKGQHHRKTGRRSFGRYQTPAFFAPMTGAQRQAALSPPLREYIKLNWPHRQLAAYLGAHYLLSAENQLKWGYPVRKVHQPNVGGIIFYAEEWRDGQLVSSSMAATIAAADQSLTFVARSSTTSSSPGNNVNARAFVPKKVAGKNVNARAFVSKRVADAGFIVNAEDGLLAAKLVARRDSCDSTTSGDSGQGSAGSQSPMSSNGSETVSSSSSPRNSPSNSNSSADDDLDSCSSYSSGTWSAPTGRSLEDIPAATSIAQPPTTVAAAAAAATASASSTDPITDDRHECARCYIMFRYQHTASGKRIPTVCRWHSGRLLRIDGSMQYVCCQKPADSVGCERAAQHVWSGHQVGLNGPFAPNEYVESAESDGTGANDHAVLALDCEMVYTEHGLELAKISVVRPNGQLVYEELVRPTAAVVDYNTRFSGITEAQLRCRSVRSLAQVQRDLLALITARTILVGHALNNDLRALRMVHGRVVDTATVFGHIKGHPYRNSLRVLVRENLQRTIQADDVGHDSFEDARSSLALLLFHVRRRYLEENNY